MPSYLILRLFSFLFAVAIPLFFCKPMAFAVFSMPLTIAHYFLAVPYSKRYVVDAMKRPSTAAYFMLLIGASVLLASLENPTLLFVAFGIHYVFSEVYLMFENVMPNLWSKTKLLRVASIVCNTFVFFASTRSPHFGHKHEAELFYWSGYVISACVYGYLFFRHRKFLTKDQITNVCAFESLGLAFVMMGLIHPVNLTNFIFYHVLFWVVYPSWKMVSYKQTKPLMVFLSANIILTGLVVLVAPYSPLPFHFTEWEFFQFFTWGALVHIVISLGTSAAQPAWITRIFHPEFTRARKQSSASQSAIEHKSAKEPVTA